MDYIKLSRKITEWEWYSDVNVCRLFIHLLISVNWKDGRFQGIEIPRGSMATSYNSLADQTGLSIMQVRTAIKKLKLTGEITVKQHPKYSVITVNNYNSYQSDNKVNNTDVTQEQQARNTGLTTIEEGKKERREEKDIYSFSNEKPSILPPPEEQIFTTIRELFNSVCGSYPRLVKMSEKRKKAVRARLRTGYTLEDFKTLFEKAEASEFLKGKNNRDWSATFDWLVCDSNMAKVLEGKYDRRENRNDTGRKATAGEEGYVKRLVEQGFGQEFEGF